MPYTIDLRHVGSFPEYRVSNTTRTYVAYNEADAEYLCWALNHLTEAQHMDALRRGERDAA